MKKLLLVGLMATMILMAGCQKTKKAEATPATTEDRNLPTVTMTVKGFGDIVVELDPVVAPNTVKNFLTLANDGFYDGLTFHRVISGFMIQGGDPNGNGTGDPGYSIKGEFNANGIENPLKHVRGVISMARGEGMDTAGSQFFIMHGDADYLDGNYAAFGNVVSGIEIVDQIAAVATDGLDKPEEDVVIEKVVVDAKGYDFSGLVTIPLQ